eukprot:3423976-Prymnesium_polylepis.1
MQLNFVLRQELERQAQPRAGYLPLAAEAGLRDQRVGDYRTMVRAGPMGREHDFRWRLSRIGSVGEAKRNVAKFAVDPTKIKV